MNIRISIEGKSIEELQSALVTMLERYTQPAFGSMPKRETDILMFEVMRALELLPKESSVYDLMTKLNITRTKASQLLFDTDIRKVSDDPGRLNDKVIEALCSGRFHKDSDKYFCLEVEAPLVNAHLKEEVRKLGHISDSSFNTSIIRLPLDAVVDVVSNLVPDDQEEQVRVALEKAGAQKALTFRSVLKSSLKALGKKYVGEAADQLVDGAGDYLASIFNDIEGIEEKWKTVFNES